MPTPCYLGEAAGARVLRVGTDAGAGPATQVGAFGDEPVLLELETWDLVPAGEVGDCLLRSIDVTGTMTNGVRLGVTPVVDGVALPEQPFARAGAGEWTVQAYVAARGARFAARVRTLDRPGDLTVHNVTASFVVLRATP